MSIPDKVHHRSSIPGSYRTRVWLVAAIAAAAMGSITSDGSRVLANDATTKPPAATCTGVGQVWWSELITPDPVKVGDFYAAVVGWKLNPVDSQGQPIQQQVAGAEYTTFTIDGEEVAGMMKSDHPNAIHQASGWLTYVQVGDVEIATAAARNSGGIVVREPFFNSDGSRLALVRDPAGNLIGLVTPRKSTPC